MDEEREREAFDRDAAEIACIVAASPHGDDLSVEALRAITRWHRASLSAPAAGVEPVACLIVDRDYDLFDRLRAADYPGLDFRSVVEERLRCLNGGSYSFVPYTACFIYAAPPAGEGGK